MLLKKYGRRKDLMKTRSQLLELFVLLWWIQLSSWPEVVWKVTLKWWTKYWLQSM
jgi:hypothetical protein